MLRITLLLISLLLSSSSGAFNKTYIQAWSFYKVQKEPLSEIERFVLQQKIMDEFFIWKGTRYLWGGDSHNGIECSAFFRRIIYKALHRHLPRTALEQSHTGRKLQPNNLV